MSKPTIKTVTVTKRGRFWAVHTDGELLALVLYKKGAMAVRELVADLAGLPMDRPAGDRVKQARDHRVKLTER